MRQNITLLYIFSIVLICLLTGLPVHAQNTGILKGLVLDADSKEQLPTVIIQAIDEPKAGSLSDDDGYYSLGLRYGRRKIACYSAGYISDTFLILIDRDTVIKDITLKPSKQMLETVIVSSGRFKQKLEDITSSMEVLKPELIASKNTTSIETALEQVPGLTIIDNDPQIRGGSGFTFGVGSRVAIVMDGIPLLSGDAGRPEWSYIPVENIEQIEVIKGVSSVLYGSSAINGAINIKTAYAKSRPKTNINYSVGRYALPDEPAENWYGSSLPMFSNLNFSHSRVLKERLDLVVGANLNVDQGYIGPANPMPELPDDLKRAFLLTDTIPTFNNRQMLKMRGRMNISLRYRSKKIQGLVYGINSNAMYNKTNMVMAWQDDSIGLYKGYAGAVFLQTQKIFNIDPYIKYFSPENGFNHSLVTRYFYTDNEITNNQSNNGSILYGEYQIQKHFEKFHLNVTGGIVSSLAKSYAQLYASSGSPHNSIQNTAGYLQLDKKLWSTVNINGGYRLEYYSTNGKEQAVAPIFRAGGNWQLLKGTYVRSSYGQGYRYPTITERFISTKAGMFGVFPNPQLQPETSRSMEIALKQGFKLGPVMGYADVAYFDQRYENTIEYLFGVWDPTIALVGFKFYNTGSSRVRGWDFSLAASTPDEKGKNFGLTALMGYTYLNPVSLSPNLIYAHTKNIAGGAGDSVSFRNSSMDTTSNTLKYRFQNMLKADIEMRYKSLSIGFSYRFYSKMKNIDKAFSDIEQLTEMVDLIPDIKVVQYWRTHPTINVFDARISYRLSDNHKIAFICNNIFNKPYALRPMKIEAPRQTIIQYMYTL